EPNAVLALRAEGDGATAMELLAVWGGGRTGAGDDGQWSVLNPERFARDYCTATPRDASTTADVETTRANMAVVKLRQRLGPLVAVLALVLAGCGGSATPVPGGTSPTPGAPS